MNLPIEFTFNWQIILGIVTGAIVITYVLKLLILVWSKCPPLKQIKWKDFLKEIWEYMRKESPRWLGIIFCILFLGMIIHESFGSIEGQYFTGAFWAMWIVLSVVAANEKGAKENMK